MYGGDIGRIYFSLDDKGNLVEHHDLVGKTLPTMGGIDPALTTFSLRGLRGWLSHLALYRMVKRSSFTMWVAMHLRTNNESLWPGLDTGLKIDLTGDDRRRVDLAGTLIGKIANEARQIGAIPVLVHIPYLAQVYDSVWESSFGSVPGYDRDLPGKRLGAFAEQYGMLYADVDPVMRNYVKTHNGAWVHFPIDSHPNAIGQRLIAETVLAVLERCRKQNPDLKPGICH